MAAFDPKLPDRGAVCSQAVGDQPLRNKGILLQKLAHQFQRGVLISFGLDQHIEDLALSVDSPPKVDHSAVDFQLELVELPSRRPGVGHDFGPNGRETERHFPTMSLDDIKALPVHEIATPAAILYLWALPHMLPKALQVMEALGFEFRTSMFWVKDRVGLGQWACNHCEPLLIGRRGSFPPPSKSLPPTICYVRSTSTRDIRPLAAGVRVASNHGVEGMLLSSLSIVPSFTELGARELSPRGCREAATEAPLLPMRWSEQWRAMGPQQPISGAGRSQPRHRVRQRPERPLLPVLRANRRGRRLRQVDRRGGASCAGGRGRPLMGEPDQAGSGALPVDPRRKKAAAAAADPYLRG